jgi:hypothetical protein
VRELTEGKQFDLKADHKVCKNEGHEYV